MKTPYKLLLLTALVVLAGAVALMCNKSASADDQLPLSLRNTWALSFWGFSGFGFNEFTPLLSDRDIAQIPDTNIGGERAAVVCKRHRMVCSSLWAGIMAAGRNPLHPVSWEHPHRGSWMGAGLYLLWCESRFNPNAYNNSPPWGARGIAQITRKWQPQISDDLAFDPVFSARYAGYHMARTNDGVDWPECNRIVRELVGR